MSRIKAIGLFFIECPILMDTKFINASITGMVICGSKTIGPNIDFDSAVIQKSCILGEIRLIGQPRTAGINEIDNPDSLLARTFEATATLALAENMYGHYLILKNPFIYTSPLGLMVMLATPALFLMLKVPDKAADLGQTIHRIRCESQKKFGISNLNTIMKNVNFSGTTLDKVDSALFFPAHGVLKQQFFLMEHLKIYFLN